MLIDLHTHSRPASFDSYITVDDLIDFAKRRYLDGICLSEHDTLWSPDDVAELARRHDFLVLPAIEVSTDSGHMLSFGLTSYVKSMYTFSTLAQQIESDRAVMVAAHPFRGKLPWGSPTDEEYAAVVDQVALNPAFHHCAGLETLNGRSSDMENAFAARACDLLQMAATAGTDTHQISDVAKCATEFDRRIETIEDLIGELRAGRFRPVNLVPAKVTS